MNFEAFASLAGMQQYEEIQIIGKDMVSQGKQVHWIAMLRKEDQAELCMLLQAEEPEKVRKQTRPGHELNRELMSGFVPCVTIDMKTLSIDGMVFECRQSQTGRLNISDLDSLLLLAKIAGAGWQLPEDHLLFKEDWERIEFRRVQFHCPCKQLPELAHAKLKAVWNQSLRRYLIEKPVRLTVGGEKDQKYGTQIAFTVQDGEGMVQDGICYINKVRLEDPWEETEQQFADPKYQKRMLEFMTPEEFASMRQSSCEAMEHVCPRGMYFVVVEYECTLDMNLQFYLSEYLDSEPDRSGVGVTMMLGIKGQEEQGAHGLRLKSALIQQPVADDVKEVPAELFEAHECLPEWEEELELV